MGKPAKCIPVETARGLQDNWVNTRAVEIERGQGSVDCREFVFSVEELEQFLEYVKTQSTDQKISSPGVRVYFAAYDSLENDKATVFLAPTVGTNPDSDNNYNIEPFNTISGGWPPKSY